MLNHLYFIFLFLKTLSIIKIHFVLKKNGVIKKQTRPINDKKDIRNLQCCLFQNPFSIKIIAKARYKIARSKIKIPILLFLMKILTLLKNLFLIFPPIFYEINKN